MTKDEQFARAKECILPTVTSWDDAYTYFDSLIERVRETLHPAFVFDAMFTMYAFIQALREMPEEGDIQALFEKMLHILIYEGKEKMGIDVSFISDKELGERTAAKMREVASGIVKEAVAAYEMESVDPKTLH